ncbi:MAG: DUF554 domain-containing protein [Desulfobacula sp.]|uniref:DUF554 domain-containing protein n=1 Tax=Desulfobacula sp. TaxID=2593537 RepID=UPI001DE65964|nr:DUF554 domain-containing protein [Desulfobacula sp.]MBT3484521.1 DUF554 domain-containing protein [Desulfobacula sp.]MBT3803159.1 DUF554 domain-containing protein [Desulfobacula sp.]MBT4024729.1 DUF554 domain-containing protein [Desulfobacula sp.]MBT4197207.1 DUF554 domain-containing protein [Desulfobacula sp.]
MLGTIVNCLTIIAGSLVGILFRNGIPEKYNQTVMQAIGLSVILIGMKNALGSNDLVIIIVSLAMGSLLGELIGIENYLERLGNFLEAKFSKKSSGFSAGFVTASLMYCIGSMAIVGSLESGLTGNHDTLFAKATLDGIVGIILSSSMGIGVLFASVPVLLYQGSITLMAGLLKPLLVPAVISQMSAVGGLLIVALGLNMIREKKLKVGNMLPAVFIPLIYFIIQN